MEAKTILSFSPLLFFPFIIEGQSIYQVPDIRLGCSLCFHDCCSPLVFIPFICLFTSSCQFKYDCVVFTIEFFWIRSLIPRLSEIPSRLLLPAASLAPRFLRTAAIDSVLCSACPADPSTEHLARSSSAGTSPATPLLTALTDPSFLPVRKVTTRANTTATQPR